MKKRLLELEWCIFIAFCCIIMTTVSLKMLGLPENCFSWQSKYMFEYVLPKCSFFISQEEQSEYRIDCPKSGIIRFIGEYDTLQIICYASFPLDFHFDGTKPTEAIHVDFGKEVKQNSSGEILSFNVEATVFSISALEKYYKNKMGKIPSDISNFQYSRTGKYKISGYEENSKFQTSFYIFFEEKLSTPTFITNRETKLSKSSDNLWKVPCRPTHYSSNVTLWQDGIQVGKEQALFSETNGFRLLTPAPQTLGLSYRCQLQHEQSFFSMNLTTTSDEISYEYKGLHQDLNVDITYEATELSEGMYRTRVRCRYHCETCNKSDVATLAAIPIKNPAMDRLRQDFVLPVFRNRSYTVVEDKTQKDINLELKVAVEEYTGAAFCGNSKEAKMASFGRILNGSVYPFPVRQDWAKVDRDSANVSFYMNIWNDRPGEKLYVGEAITFKCRLQTFVTSKPSRWILEWEDGTTKDYLDDSWSNGLSSLTVLLTRGLRKVYCAASFYYQTNWRNISMDIFVRGGVAPSFENSQLIQRYPLNSVGQFIKFQAWGDPLPSVRCERNGKVMQSIDAKNLTLLPLPQIKHEVAGLYICFACNIINCSRMEFIVEIVDESSTFIAEVFVALIIVAMLSVLISTFISRKWVGVSRQNLQYFTSQETTARKNANGLTPEEVAIIIKFRDGDKGITSVSGSEYAHSQPFNIEHEKSRENFYISKEELGCGAFGVVLKGTVDGETVAVKTIKTGASKQHLEFLLSELKILSYLGYHDNLVELCGAYTQELSKGFAYIFLKYCALGNLKNYLRKYERDFCFPNSSQRGYIKFDQVGKTKLKIDDLFDWSIQIAGAMEYLTEKKVIHGDLAARNILLTENRQAKVTDFGLSRRRTYEYVKCGAQKSKNSGPQPWRWVALEFFHFGPMNLSMASDVWSFGILLWEIFSLGKRPYREFICCNEDFVLFLERNERLKKPTYSSNSL